MTEDEFFHYLSTISGNFRWTITIPSENDRVKWRGMIRGKKLGVDEQNCPGVFCPLTAVAYMKLGGFFPVSRASHAAKLLHIDIPFLNTLMGLADGHSEIPLETRNRLLNALGKGEFT